MISFARSVVLIAMFFLACPIWSRAEETSGERRAREEVWALSTPWPVLAWVVRPLSLQPHGLVIMNHGIAIAPDQRAFFPPIEYRDAAFWFAKQGYVVVSPVRYGSTQSTEESNGLFGLFAGDVGKCDNPDFRGPGLQIARLDRWVIDYLLQENVIGPKDKIVIVGQSGGAWGSIALSSLNLPSIRAIVTFAAGRGGRVDGKPNNNCAPDKLVEAVGQFGKTSRVPMLWIYSENDTYFGPDLAKRLHTAFTAAGGKAELHILPAHGSDGHFLIDAADAIPMWSPLVSRFLNENP
jgi:dienelactone hydrolase